MRSARTVLYIVKLEAIQGYDFVNLPKPLTEIMKNVLNVSSNTVRNILLKRNTSLYSAVIKSMIKTAIWK